MSRRTKIIFVIVLAILVAAILWFVYKKNQASQAVRGQNGNVSSLFPFTGTNATDYQQEPNSGLPSKTSSGSGSNGLGNGNGNGNGSGNGFGGRNNNGLNTNGLDNGNNGLGLYSGNGIGNGFGDVLNLNDLTVGNGTDGTYNYPTPGIPGLGLNDLGTLQYNCPDCTSGFNPYAGQISLKANGSEYYTNLSSDGGNVELSWILANGAPIDTSGISCMASSSRGDWTGSKNPTGGPDTITLPANTTQNVTSRTYTINCSGIGATTVTVNTAGVNSDGSTGIIQGSLNFTVDNSVVALVDAAGGSVDLAWNIQLPDSVASTVCTGRSSVGDWTGTKSSTTGADTVAIPANTGTSTLSRTYTLSCTSLGSQTVTVNTNISDDAFADRTPEFLFTANGAKTLTVITGTPVTLAWQVRNLNASSCIGTSDGSYAGWGTNYDYSSDTMSSADSIALNSYNGQLNDKRTQLNALITVTSVSGTTVTTSDVQAQITTAQTNLNNTIANITTKTNDISATKVNLQNATVNVTNLNNQLRTKQTEVNQLQSHASALGGLTIDAISGLDSTATAAAIQDASTTISNIQNTLLPAATTAVSTYNTQLDAQKADLATLTTSSNTLKTQIKTLTTALHTAQTNTQVSQDNAIQGQIQTLQVSIDSLQAKADAITQKYANKHLHKLSRGKTTKAPFSNIGPTATSFSETAGLENVVAYGYVGGTSGPMFSGSDGSGGSIIGDVPITTKRMYTLTCTDATGKVLTPQTVVINVDDSGNNNNGNGDGTSTDPTFTFLVNGGTSADISIGDSVKLTWQVANLPANSCRGSSTSGLYEGWGASYQRVMHVRRADGTVLDNSRSYRSQPGDFIFYTRELMTDPGGTLKAPSAVVGTNSQTYTEVVGSDNSITTTRTYTLSCTDSTGEPLSPQTVTINVSNNPDLSFLIDGATHESVATGTTATLSWTVRNVKGGSCKATSTGNVEDLATSNGNFLGWGADLEAPRVSVFVTGGTDNIEKRKLVTAVAGGTTKDPSADVSSISKNYSEIIGQDGSIDSAERTYTLTCLGLDGTTVVTQTVVINGPDDGGNGGDDNHNPSNDPCADDMDISMALTNLQSYINTYKAITGNTILNTSDDDYLSNGDPRYITHVGSNPYNKDGDATDSIDSCMTDVYRKTDGTDSAGNTNPINYKYNGPLVRTDYDRTIYDNHAPLDAGHQLDRTEGYDRKNSYLPGWYWIDDDLINHPDHTPGPTSISSWTYDPKTYIATGIKSGGGIVNGIYVGDLLDLANIVYRGDGNTNGTNEGGDGCPSDQGCLFVHDTNNLHNKNYDYSQLRIGNEIYGGKMFFSYTGSDGSAKTAAHYFCPRPGASHSLGNGGWPIITGRVNTTAQGDPYDSNGVPMGAVEIHEAGDGDECSRGGGVLRVTYYDDYFGGSDGFGIGRKIEQAIGFY